MRNRLLEGAEEMAPEALRLAVAQGNAEPISVAEGVVALGLPRSGCRSLPPRPEKPPACFAPDGRGGRWHRGRRTGRCMVQRPAQKGFHMHTCALAYAAHLRFGDAAGVGLHHHGVESLVDPAAWLEPVGKEAALSQLLLRRSLAAMGWPG
jgi:hypothetical protein